jgi:hypothetical protein
LAHPDKINKPGALQSILYGEYLIVLFADNKVILFKYRDETIVGIIDDIFEPILHLLLDKINGNFILATKNILQIRTIPLLI